MDLSDGQTQKLPRGFVASSKAASLVGYTPDYVSRLAREGKIEAEQKEGGHWQVDVESLKLFSLKAEKEKRERKQKLRQERLLERVAEKQTETQSVIADSIKKTNWLAYGQTFVVTLCLFLVLNLWWVAHEAQLDFDQLTTGSFSVARTLSQTLVSGLMMTPNQEASLAFSESTLTENNFTVTDDIVVVNADSEQTLDTVKIPSTAVNDFHTVFSDEVVVEFSQDGSGLITPIFRNGKGESYRLEVLTVKSVNK